MPKRIRSRSITSTPASSASIRPALAFGFCREGGDDQRCRGLRGCRGGQGNLSRRVGQAADMRSDEVFDASRDLQRLTDLLVSATARVRACQLEREERVPAGRLGELAEQRSRQGEPEPGRHQLMERRQREGLRNDALEAVVRQRVGDPERKLASGFGTAGEQQTDGARQPAEREREGLLGGRVEPLEIVDRDEHGLPLGESGEDADERGGRRSRRAMPSAPGSSRRSADPSARSWTAGRSARVSSKAVPTRSARAT